MGKRQHKGHQVTYSVVVYQSLRLGSWLRQHGTEWAHAAGEKAV